MQLDVGEFLFDLSECIDVVLESQFRMMTALEQQLIAAVAKGFPDLFPIRGHVGDIGLGVTGDAVEIAEFTIGDTDVGGIDVSVDLPGNFSVWYLDLPQFVGNMYEIGQRRLVVQVHSFLQGQKLESGCFGVNIR